MTAISKVLLSILTCSKLKSKKVLITNKINIIISKSIPMNILPNLKRYNYSKRGIFIFTE
jgi:hypothetical protein